MDKLKCENCGNEKEFYVNCDVSAKAMINPKTRKINKVFDINKNDAQPFEIIYCKKCGETVLDDSDY